MEFHKNIPKPQIIANFVDLVRDKTLDTLSTVAPSERERLLGLKSNGDFRKQFREAVEGAVSDFAANHTDSQVALAITASQEFWGNPELERAFVEIATKPLVYIGVYPASASNLADNASLRVIRKLFVNTLPHLATTEPERIEQGVQAFIRFLALRVMSMPSLTGVYANYIAFTQGREEFERFEKLTQILQQHHETLILISEKLEPLGTLEALLTRASASVNIQGKGAPTMPELQSGKFDKYTRLQENLEDIIELLLECSSMSSMSSLKQVISQLPGEIKRVINYPDDAALTERVRRVIDACLKVARWEGIETLIQRIAFFDGGTIAFTDLTTFLNSIGLEVKLRK